MTVRFKNLSQRVGRNRRLMLIAGSSLFLPCGGYICTALGIAIIRRKFLSRQTKYLTFAFVSHRLLIKLSTHSGLLVCQHYKLHKGTAQLIVSINNEAPNSSIHAALYLHCRSVSFR